MADEINIPTHRYYQTRYHVKLAPNEVSRQLIYASGIRKIDNAVILPLFALAEPGVWYDPSDLTTLYQDSAGTTPVTTPGQTVGLMLDKSQNGVGTNGSACRNLLTYTEQFDNAAWTSQGVNLAANSILAPDGTLTADKIIPTAVSTTHGIFRLGVVSSQTCAVSFYMKSGGYDTVHALDGATASNGAVFNSATGVVTNTGTGVGSMSAVGNGWYRCVVIVATTGARFYVPTANSTFTGDGTSGVYLWGAQLELGSTATAYQPITSSWSATIAGNHATQATLAQRPTYGINPIVGTRNLLTYTEQFDNAAWSKYQASITANNSVAPDGSMTADKLVDTAVLDTHITYRSTALTVASYTLTVYAKSAEKSIIYMRLDTASAKYAYFDLSSGTVLSANAAYAATITSVGNGWFRCSITTTASVATYDIVYGVTTANNVTTYTGNGTDGILIWGAQLELGSTATAYQKVVTQYEVTEAGVQSVSYLAFDGVDDGMVTNTITPAIDKVQVFSGVRKLSDAAIGIVAELSVSGPNGVFYLSAPRLSGTANYGFYSQGTIGGSAVSGTTFASPTTNVITGIGDISAPVATLRVNGVQVATATTTQGTGNYLAYPLYLGRRGGSSLPYNGRLYSLITRFGANLTDGQITSTESWVNAKVGAY